ncbi:MAG: RteC domain-containing protein [Mangrovibacterium sp.]
MESHLKIVKNLENVLSKTKEVSQSLPEQMEYAIGHCKIALDRMRELVVKEGFADKESEIEFFKKVKPSVYSRLLFYRAVFDLETKRQEKDREGTRRYLERKLEKIVKCLARHEQKVQYSHCHFTHLDEKYFLRKRTEIPAELRDSRQLLDEEFFTWHDHTFAVIMAGEMLADYILKEIGKLETPGKNNGPVLKPGLQWTGKKIDYAEMIYSIHYAKVVNGGNITIKELTGIFDGLFGLDLGKDIYRYYTEIQQRKINRTKFLDFLRSVLQQRLDEEDE